jgi:hypothetical protein
MTLRGKIATKPRIYPKKMAFIKKPCSRSYSMPQT